MDIPETRYARSGDVSIAYHERIDDDDGRVEGLRCGRDDHDVSAA